MVHSTLNNSSNSSNSLFQIRVKKYYQQPAMQAYSMDMTCKVCNSSIKQVSGNSGISWGGKSSNNASGQARTKDRGWGDDWDE